ncbi:MAG TPA: arsinothricin resistance N-acetyltransferase ArsN1 family B [Gammaproteobacteria bacterium]|nr:arsinothricin resistance N-acetyltransferase ArsN1 family B [Gammaproteobacteria bacterium]
MNMSAIRPARTEDAGAIAAIYNHYIAHSVATFETELVTTQVMARRMTETAEAGLPWLIAQADGAPAGYTYASKWKGRQAYRYAVEVSVYLASGAMRRGWGTALYSELLARLRSLSLHTAIGGVTLPNPASVALHENFGFEKVAHFREVGFKFGQWLDVAYWQRSL